MDVKSAFREVGVAPDRAAAFAYRLQDLVLVDLRLQFGWLGSPGGGGVVASAIQEAQRTTTRASAGTSAAAIKATSHVGGADRRGRTWSHRHLDAGFRRCEAEARETRVGDIARG